MNKESEELIRVPTQGALSKKTQLTKLEQQVYDAKTRCNPKLDPGENHQQPPSRQACPQCDSCLSGIAEPQVGKRGVPKTGNHVRSQGGAWHVVESDGFGTTGCVGWRGLKGDALGRYPDRGAWIGRVAIAVLLLG